MSKFSKAIAKFFGWISKMAKSVDSVYDSLTEDLKRLVPVAVNTVQVTKSVLESGTGSSFKELLKVACPSPAGDVAIDIAYNWLKEKGLPYLLKSLQISEAILNIEDKEEQLLAVLSVLNVADDRSEKRLELAAGILNALSDGRITFSECLKIAGDYYDNYVKPLETAKS